MKFEDYQEIPLVPVSSDDIPLEPPTGGGHMTVSQAAFWIMTEGGTQRVPDLREAEPWRGAFDALLRRIASAEVEVVGRPVGGEGHTQRIDGVMFSGIAVAYPCQHTPIPMIFGDAAGYLQAVLLSDDSYCDSLNAARSVTAFTHVAVLRSDVVRFWPFTAATTSTPKDRRYSEPTVRDWYRRRVKGWQGRAPTVRDDQAALKAAFPGVGRELFRTLRKEFAPASWKESGPKK